MEFLLLQTVLSDLWPPVEWTSLWLKSVCCLTENGVTTCVQCFPKGLLPLCLLCLLPLCLIGCFPCGLMGEQQHQAHTEWSTRKKGSVPVFGTCTVRLLIVSFRKDNENLSCWLSFCFNKGQLALVHCLYRGEFRLPHVRREEVWISDGQHGGGANIY